MVVRTMYENKGSADDKDYSGDHSLPICFNKKRHNCTSSINNAISKSWRIRDRMKTVSVALVVCLNVGVDPPDVFKITPCARLECWIDPSSVSPQKALEMIGINLQRQYERWQPRARYKQSLDPTVEDIKKLCSSLRRNAKEERVLFHYNGHGVPKPTVNGEIWVFNRTYTQYIPLSIYDLQSWMGSPSIYVYDCSNAGIIVNSFNQFAEQHEREMEVASNRGSPGATQPPTNPPHSFKNCLQMAACTATQILPMNPQLPADLFTSCLTTPIKIALKWFTLQHPPSLVPKLSTNFIDRIPGQLNDRRTMLGELNWIFTAITDTIAWSTMPRDLFQKLFRQDLLVASLFRNFLLADRIMRSYDCTPITCPELPSCHRHSMWSAWDICVDLALQQLPGMLENGMEYENLTFFEDQLTAFHVWLERGSKDRTPPLQLPIVLQVLLSQVHRIRALELLGRFLDLGPWAVHTALSVGIFPYVLKLLQASSKELRPLLVFIWAKILAVDSTCQVDLVCDKGHKYFLSVLQDTTIEHEYRTMAAFILASIVQNFPLGQANALQGSMVSICLVHIYDCNSILRQWLAICLGNLWQNYDKARWSGVRDLAHEKLYPLLQDTVPEVRAAAVYALGTFISSVTNHKDRTEHANNIDRSIAMTLLTTVGNDMSPIVRMELIAALQWMVILFENLFVSVFLQEPTTGIGLPASTSHHTHSLERNINIKRVSSSSSIANLSGTSSLNNFQTTIGFGSIYMKLWRGLIALCRDPHPDVADMATKEIDFIVNQAVDLISAKEATKENFSSSLSLPPSPNTRISYLGDSPPHHINHNTQLNASTTAAITTSDATKIFSPSNGGRPRGSRCSTPTSLNQQQQQQQQQPQQQQHQQPQQQPRSRKNSKNITIDENVSSTTVDLINTDAKHQNLDNSTTIELNTNQHKPIVTTGFLNWCISQFSSASTLKIPKYDCHAPDELDREWRFQRNEEVRKIAREQCVQCNRLETQSWLGRTQFTPQIVKLHPYEPQIAVAYKNKIMLNDWVRGVVRSCVPQQSIPPKPTAHSILGHVIGVANAKVTALEFLNAHDKTLILAGYEDGGIRIWRPPSQSTATSSSSITSSTSSLSLSSSSSSSLLGSSMSNENSKESELVTAWQAIGDVTKFQNVSGLVTTWQQQSQTIIVANGTNSIRLWNVDAELKLCDIRTGSDSSVVVLNTAPNELFAAGFADGSVRLYDKRCPPTDAKIMTCRESTAQILSLCLMEDCTRFVTGCSKGKIRVYDIRKGTSLPAWSADGDVTDIAIHPAADLVAIGTNSINIYSLDGRQISTIRTHGFMGQRVCTATCLSFHSFRVSLAIGYVDNTVAVYVSETR